MKKKIIGATFVVAIAVVAAFNLNLNKSNAKADLAMSNVEALADGEYSQPVWNIYNRPDGTGYNCYKWGEKICF
ncbi:hypothetical protein Palpr_1567 [Paludibacter propionicigenes WB4]|uniref:NVEALA family protein n=1 Tax=Paludibacter propionicigenes (strain DSM 17365 / JCM 13257 / WB4) TaxID=694427 RepID=E4T4R8_PALPW|nr:NVEALA domain-containing protein [Paludibacter propionicigenes]ADQ79712.1 hypothetical protein Palpr_1567 [Paludibacter propionicigenes WB4]